MKWEAMLQLYHLNLKIRWTYLSDICIITYKWTIADRFPILVDSEPVSPNPVKFLQHHPEKNDQRFFISL